MTPRTWQYNGKQLTAAEVAALNPRLKLNTVLERLRRGWSVAEAIKPKLSRSQAGRRGRIASERALCGRCA